jgi:hypothetical protein
MRGLTVASQPGPFFGTTGVLLVALGVALAIADDDWIPLLIAALGVVFLAMALVARRATPS